MPYVDGVLIPSCVAQSPTPNMVFNVSILAQNGAEITSPSIKSITNFGVPIATATMPAITIEDSLIISLSMPISQLSGSPPLANGDVEGLLQMQLGIVDSTGKPLLVPNMGTILAAIDSKSTLAAINYNNGIITYDYTSNPTAGLNVIDNMYYYPWNTGLVGPYTLTLYVNVDEVVCLSGTGTTTASFAYANVSYPDIITTANIPNYMTQTDILNINLPLTTQNVNVSSAVWKPLLKFAFPTACSYWSMQLTNLVVQAANITGYTQGNNATFTFCIANLDSHGSPDSQCNTWGFTYTFNSAISNTVLYTLPTANTLLLTYYNDTPTDSLYLCMFVSSSRTTFEGSINNILMKGTLTASPFIDSVATITAVG